MEQIKNHKELVDIIQQDISNTDKDIIAVQAGHFPLNFNHEKGELSEDFRS